MSWDSLPAHLEARVSSEISIASKLITNKPSKMRNKYGNTKVEAHGLKFDSKKECNRYEELLLLQKAGLITELETQPKFELLGTLRYNGATFKKRSYIGDFRYFEKSTQKTVVEDVKSSKKLTAKMPLYTIKRHMFIEKYGHEVEFREIF